MSARVCLTGTAVARRPFAPRSTPERGGVHRARRAAAGPRHRAGRRRSGVRDLRPQQAEGRRRGRAAGPISSGCRRRASLDELLAAGRSAEPRARRTTASSCSRRCRRRWATTPSSAVFDAIDPGEGRGRVSRPSTSAGWCRTARTWWRARPSGVIELLERSRHRRSPARAPSSSAAATSSASRWRCCCCTATRR